MYESPIEIIQTQMQMQMDGEILKAVQGVGIDVNKEELLKALAYDREQYSKGYKDGVKDLAERLKESIIQENDLYVKCAKSLLSTDYQQGYEEKNNTIIKCIDNLLAEMVGGENA